MTKITFFNAQAAMTTQNFVGMHNFTFHFLFVLQRGTALFKMKLPFFMLATDKKILNQISIIDPANLYAKKKTYNFPENLRFW